MIKKNMTKIAIMLFLLYCLLLIHLITVPDIQNPQFKTGNRHKPIVYPGHKSV